MSTKLSMESEEERELRAKLANARAACALMKSINPGWLESPVITAQFNRSRVMSEAECVEGWFAPPPVEEQPDCACEWYRDEDGFDVFIPCSLHKEEA